MVGCAWKNYAVKTLFLFFFFSKITSTASRALRSPDSCEGGSKGHTAREKERKKKAHRPVKGRIHFNPVFDQSSSWKKTSSSFHFSYALLCVCLCVWHIDIAQGELEKALSNSHSETCVYRWSGAGDKKRPTTLALWFLYQWTSVIVY
jgi:hypothetical protein